MKTSSKIISVAAMIFGVSVVAWPGDFEEGVAAFKKENYTVALQKFRKLTAQGNADAQFKLAILYRNGLGVAKDSFEAAGLFELAAVQGHAEAAWSLGLMYNNGQGIVQNYTEAARWYKLAAELGNARSQTTLAIKYENGEGVVQDYTEAVRWYKLAASQGDEIAQNYLASMYFKGQGVQQNYIRGHMWANLSTAAGTYDSPFDSPKKKRDAMASVMTPTQIAEAQKLARECQARNFKNCD